MKLFLRFFFVVLFALSAFYIVSVETERYESKSIALLKDLAEKQKMDLSKMLLGQGSSTMEDSKVLELYIRSHEMFNYINNEYNLTKHYTSKELDVLQRLYVNSTSAIFKANQQNFLEKYNKDLLVDYDDPSGTLELTFIHTDPELAQSILKSILDRAEEVINDFEKENSEIALTFTRNQIKKNREIFVSSIRKLVAYQNKNHTIDPTLDVQRKITILSELEMELVKSEVEYATKLKVFNKNSREMKMIRENSLNLKASIKRVKKQLSGTGEGHQELNTNVFDFELLKSDMELSKEIYRQTLINQEELKVEVAQKSRHLVIIEKPTLADDYTYPNVLWDVFTLSIVLLFIYSILMTILTIIRSHKD